MDLFQFSLLALPLKLSSSLGLHQELSALKVQAVKRFDHKNSVAIHVHYHRRYCDWAKIVVLSSTMGKRRCRRHLGLCSTPTQLTVV